MDRPRHHTSRVTDTGLPRARVVPRSLGEHARRMRSSAWQACRHRARAAGRLTIKLAPLGIAGMAVVGIIATLGSMRVHTGQDTGDPGQRLRQFEVQLRVLEQMPVWYMDHEPELGRYERELEIIEIHGEHYLLHSHASPGDHQCQFMILDEAAPDAHAPAGHVDEHAAEHARGRAGATWPTLSPSY